MERYSAGALHRYTSGTGVARPENGTHSLREYGLLAPTGDSAAARNQVSGDAHKATRVAADQAWRETGMGDGTRQCELPARVMQGADDKERRPSERSRALNVCNYQGGERRGGGAPSITCPQRAARDQGGTLDMAVHARSARTMIEGGGGTPHPAARTTRARVGERGGHPGQAAFATTACSLRAEEWGTPPKRQCAHFIHGMQEREGG